MSILEQGLEAQANVLRDFGYPSVTADMVREAHRKFMAGEEAGDVIEMFCKDAFERRPEIFGEPAKP